ncbi:ATP-binding protein [Adhaeribacter aquaticus]|uniref:ATP-binding protein n=1 Tax=Adhaeribacter aquaticus TaxID=299567 RepID=UPI00040B5C75|nr:ATP-binding protein [Adhaeribacter aquaticus]
MERDILTIKLENELDIVLAYKRAMQLSTFCGIALANQTKFATAVSEISRNVLEHVGQGIIKYSIVETDGHLYLEGLVTDRGRGISNVEELLKQHAQPQGLKGWGILNSRKLVEYFAINSEYEKGTRVTLRKEIPHNHPPINKAIIKGWLEHFKEESDISPYAEIKTQNMQLIELLDQLRLKNIETEYQLEEIRRLNAQLQTSNHEISTLLQERDKSNEKLTVINRELDKFAHIVSHDLKGPIYNIYSLARIIEEDIAEDNFNDISKTAGMIKAQATRMEKFIYDVLLYSTAGKQSIPKTKVDLNILIQNLLHSHSIPAHIKVAVKPGLPTLFTEEIYLQQIFSNLISNAIKYNDKEEGYIFIDYQVKEGLLQFSVADNGPGIPLAEQETIFKAYETGSLHRNISTGLGLSIIDKIIQLKKTAIWVESKGRNGTTFKFTWPIDEVI